MEAKPTPATKANLSVAQRIASGFSCAPPSFEMVPKLLLLLDDPHADGQALADLIRVDAGLTADILRVANSAYYARGNRVGSLLEAANRIGFREIYRTVVDILASPILAADQAGLARLDLWRHSLAAALAGKLLAENTGIGDEDIAFTAALLHDIGKIAFGHAFGHEYEALIEKSRTSGTAAATLERAAFDTDHSEVGATLLRRWNFPDRITTGIMFHHIPQEAPAAERGFAALLYAADIMAHRLGSEHWLPDFAATPQEDSLRLIGLSPASLFDYDEVLHGMLDREQKRLRAAL